jgi:hypothetical protein
MYYYKSIIQQFRGITKVFIDLIRIMNETIEATLAAGSWGFEDLPLRDDSALWARVHTACSLTDQELSRLKNTRCPPPGTILFHPIFIYIYRSSLMKLTPLLLLYIYFLTASATATAAQGM